MSDTRAPSLRNWTPTCEFSTRSLARAPSIGRGIPAIGSRCGGRHGSVAVAGSRGGYPARGSHRTARTGSDQRVTGGAVKDRVGVVVPCKDEVATIERCLTALRAQQPAPARIVVADNGSTDG